MQMEFLLYVISSLFCSLYLCFPANQPSAALIICLEFQLVDEALDCSQTAESTKSRPADVHSDACHFSSFMTPAAGS